jgi:parallel beta-helix repeat protein
MKIRFLLSFFICSAVISTLTVSCSPEVIEDRDADTTLQPEEVDEPDSVAVQEQPTDTTDSAKITTSGHIISDETWSGTVHITGEIFIDEGVKVNILPGTIILFAAHQDDQHFGTGTIAMDEWIAKCNDPTANVEYYETHIAIRGTIIARGTPEQMITFTSDSPAPDGGDWIHLHLGYGSVIEYCIIEYSNGGLDVQPGTGDSIVISNNIIRHNLATALTVHFSSPTITYNEIYDSGGHQGIAVEGEESAPLIAHNIIKDCKLGIAIGEDADPVVEYNTLLDNDFGISVLSSVIIRNNSISSPEGAHQHFTYQGVPVYPASALEGRYEELGGIIIINSSPTITHNKIFDVPRIIFIVGNSSPLITYNDITGGQPGGGVLVNEDFTGEPRINYNNIYDNGANIGLQPGFTGTIDAINNWWGTTDEVEIEGKIHDNRNDGSLGTVIYEPFLEEPINID